MRFPPGATDTRPTVMEDGGLGTGHQPYLILLKWDMFRPEGYKSLVDDPKEPL